MTDNEIEAYRIEKAEYEAKRSEDLMWGVGFRSQIFRMWWLKKEIERLMSNRNHETKI